MERDQALFAQEHLMDQKVARIAILQSLGQPLDYLIGEIQKIQVGSFVQVPLRNQTARGIVVELTSSSPHSNLKKIERLIHSSGISKPLLQLVQWLSLYYCCRLDQILKCALPANLGQEITERSPLIVKRKRPLRDLRRFCEENRVKLPKQVAVIDCLLALRGVPLVSTVMKKAKVSRSPIDALAEKKVIEVLSMPLKEQFAIDHEYFISKPKLLNQEQEKALLAISASIDQDRPDTHLLHGVTGSGKTEVFLQATQIALQKGKKVLILVPEISLTPQTVERFKSRFSQKLGVIHYRIKPKEKLKIWQQLTDGEIDVVIGARSAIFCPLHPLGLIVLDEEHESSYKSDQLPYYHAREVLQKRAQIEKATLILASATPTLQTYHRAKQGEIGHQVLSKRAALAQIPPIKMIDMTQESEKFGGGPLLSNSLIKALKERGERGEQSLLFLNRRGYRSSLMCQNCQQAIQCSNCDISLTYHLQDKALCCHFCGMRRALINTCPQCKGNLTFRGFGTQHIEQSLRHCLPQARVLRADRDTTEAEGALERILLQFSTGKADVLIGTQMIGKGHHFPAVTLVGILNPDHGLHIPDYRASERLFQTITQVSGRAGRAALSGQVMLQTHHPDHELYQMIAQGDFAQFYEQEMISRSLFQYPPSLHLVRCLIRSENIEEAKALGEELFALAKDQLPSTVLLSPPQPAPQARLQSHHRYQFLIKTKKVIPVSRLLFGICQTLRSRKGTVSIDVDPENLV